MWAMDRHDRGDGDGLVLLFTGHPAATLTIPAEKYVPGEPQYCLDVDYERSRMIYKPCTKLDEMNVKGELH